MDLIEPNSTASIIRVSTVSMTLSVVLKHLSVAAQETILDYSSIKEKFCSDIPSDHRLSASHFAHFKGLNPLGMECLIIGGILKFMIEPLLSRYQDKNVR